MAVGSEGGTAIGASTPTRPACPTRDRAAQVQRTGRGVIYSSLEPSQGWQPSLSVWTDPGFDVSWVSEVSVVSGSVMIMADILSSLGDDHWSVLLLDGVPSLRRAFRDRRGGTAGARALCHGST